MIAPRLTAVSPRTWRLGGAAALVLALLLAMTLGRGLAAERDALQARAALLAARAPAALPQEDDSAAAQLARFHAGFPPVADSARSLAQLQAAAQRAGLVLASGEYRLESRAGEVLQRYAVLLPLSGSYAQLRAFIDHVLAEVPHAAIDDVELRRDGAGDTRLQARLRLTLYLRGSGGAGSGGAGSGVDASPTARPSEGTRR